MSGTATARLGLDVAAQPATGGTFGNTIANFGSGNELALAGLTNSSVSYNSSNSSITVTGTRTSTGGQVSENFVLSAPRTTSFTATVDGQNNTIIRAATPTPPPPNPPCYCTGTQILTDRGEVAVEALAIGDVVVTALGAHRPIRWIGNRSYIGRFANTNPAVLPVCVKAGALADGVPNRDLWVSPDHALYLDGVLIPAEHLVNGATIVKAERVESLTYWHIELDGHDVLLAEGAPAESFVDDHGRAIFHNAASYRALYPNQPAWPVAAVYCAERVKDGYALEAVRRRLALRAGQPVAPARVFGELLGHLDLCDGLRISGWAQDLAHPDGPVCLDIVVDGAVVALAYAETYRADLEAAGIGDGCHAFDLELPQPLALEAAHTVEVRRSADGAVVGTLRIETAITIAA
ncbi:Hint domain-containing protein [Methylobacterium mesophilicum]